MRRGFGRIPIPLILALAVAVGVSVTIIFKITVVPPPSAVVAPIETSATSLDTGSSTYLISVDVASGSYVNYPTLAGLGKLQLKANTTGWYYLQTDWFVTVVRRSTGDAVFVLSNNRKVHVREINNTHAVVFFDKGTVAVVTQKVQVGTTGWIVYHPVPTSYDDTTKTVLQNIISSLGYTYIYVFQPKADYVKYDANTKYFYMYLDMISSSGSVTVRGGNVKNATNFIPISANMPVTVNGIEQIDTNNYVLYSVWALFYYQPTSNTKSEFTITPVQ